MTRRIVFRPAAEDHLVSLYRYISENSDRSRAAAYVARIETACMGLANFPERGTRRDDLALGLRTIGFERRVTIAFRVLDDVVEIVAIAYAGRNFGDDLAES